MTARPGEPWLAAHPPDWADGRCRVCLQLWPCTMLQALLGAMYLDAPRALTAWLEGQYQQAAAVRPASEAERLREQILGWRV